jgi:hypothetical protein
MGLKVAAEHSGDDPGAATGLPRQGDGPGSAAGLGMIHRLDGRLKLAIDEG